MALDFSKIKELIKPLTEFNFGKLNSRARILVIIGGMLGIVLVMYLVSNYFFGGTGTGSATVASAPAGLKTLPGAQVTPEYERVIREVEQKRTKEAELTGGSSIGSISNISNQNAGGASQCNIICSDQSVNVKNTLDDWARRGDINDEVASELQQLANSQVSVDDYAARLNQLVKEGKLTPEQARELLAQYKKQYANARLQESAAMMDDMIKAGTLPLDLANQLLSMQKEGVTPAQYAAYLNQLVKEGKLSPAAAQQLLAQYSKQHTKQVIDQSIAFIRQLGRDGKLVKEIEDKLIQLEVKFVPLEEFTAAVNQFTQAGQLIPATANLLIDEYKMQKGSVCSSDTIIALVSKAETNAKASIDTAEKTKVIVKETADQLRNVISQDPPVRDAEVVMTQLVQQNKLSTDVAKQKIADYQMVRGLRDLSRRLTAAQADNASADGYVSILRDAVQNHFITPDDASRLMNEYQACLNLPTASTSQSSSAGAVTDEFARMQKESEASSNAAAASTASVDQFQTASTDAQQTSDQDRQALIQALMGTMSGQAQQLISSWQPPVMQVKEGALAKAAKEDTGVRLTIGKDGATATEKAVQTTVAPVLIKAGAILFAVLDTEANSDFPESPIMATIVQGPFKGAKLLGKLSVSKSVAGQMDKISLNFTIMNTESWPKSKTVTAFAIDPDTAKTVLATEVDYHYLQRFGAVMATSFVQGYADAIKSSGGQISQTGLSTTTANPALSPSNKLAVGVGKIGEILGDVTQNYVNIPPTVKISAGVGIGILFMSDLT